MGVDRDCTEVGDDFVRVPSSPEPDTRRQSCASSVTTDGNTPGLRRTNASDDGSTNEEELLTVDEPAPAGTKEDLLPLYTERLKPAMSILKDDLEC
ncbi:hypothetical protein [Micromonospora sp. AMSO31t]|uniref:hypothetical protein n=1 Tax=Micromonospora sp. AMSO31t TaxID=2650566 RepID=UPI00124B77EB|nr:hypothetical protein [Micromonospora sp. AMSO31t]KAB1915731.1 hypothetical protein F8274_02685 [Micromonospora sp. AMSO31t]